MVFELLIDDRYIEENQEAKAAENTVSNNRRQPNQAAPEEMQYWGKFATYRLSYTTYS